MCGFRARLASWAAKRPCVNTRLSAGDLPVASVCKLWPACPSDTQLKGVPSCHFEVNGCLWQKQLTSVWRTYSKLKNEAWKTIARLMPGCLQELIFWAQFSFILTLFVNFGWFHVCWNFGPCLPCFVFSGRSDWHFGVRFFEEFAFSSHGSSCPMTHPELYSFSYNLGGGWCFQMLVYPWFSATACLL